MFFQFNFWLLSLSAIASSIAALVTFNFVDRLHTSSIQKQKILLPIFALVVGSSIWANHELLGFAFKEDLGETRNLFPSMTLLAWGCATLGATAILNAACKREFKFSHALKAGVITGLCTLGMCFFDTSSIHGVGNIQPDLFSAAVSTIFASGISAALIWLLSWQRAYSGTNPIPVKMLLAFIVTLGVIAVHAGFNRAFAHGEIANATTVYTQLMGIVVALAFLCLILLTFILILFFEKHGAKFFKFNFLNRQKNAENQLYNLEDSLTKLPNRNAFQQHLENAAKRSARTGAQFAVAYIDLDHFKPINDQYGHHVGDAVLIKVAERLNASIRGCDFVARIGGDEFVAIIEEIKSTSDATPIVERMLNLIKEPFRADGYQIDISCSIGVAVYPKDGDVSKLMHCADAAMYKAKENGKNQFKFYDEKIEFASEQLLELQSELCLGIENKEFFVEFQPKLDCKTQMLTGAEALVRWSHPTKGVLTPKAFLPAAERFGLVNEINDWVLEECCKTIAKAKQLGIDLNISINLSSLQFRNPNLVDEITKTMQQYHISASSLMFEIKETITIKNQAQFKLLLDMLSEAGLKVALDDFGLHPISLGYLQELNLSEVKLDKTFVMDMHKNVASKELADGVIKLAHALNLNVVAEGVEEEMQHHLLKMLGCDQMQGYLFSRAICKKDLFNLYLQEQDKIDPTTPLLASEPQAKEIASAA